MQSKMFKTATNIRLDTHGKVANNSKSVPADLHFRKPWHTFNLYGKFILIQQLSNVHTSNKDTLKLQLKCCEDL